MSTTPRSSLEIARASYRHISLYAPDRRPCAVDLSDNTNVWGMPPAAERAIREAATSSVTRYPELYSSRLKSALGDYLSVSPDQLVTGCGSDDVLDSAVRAFAEPGDRVAIPDPSFAMLPILAHMNGLEPVLVPLTASYDVDADAMLATDARIIYLCSPNNPTGTAFTRGAVERIIEHARGVVIVDEAYAEFANSSLLDLFRDNPRVLVSRTLSKAFGLAGMRVGYGVGSAELVAEVEKSRGPYKVNALAEAAAVAALTDGMDWVRQHVQLAVENRERLAAALSRMGLPPLPSESNFVLVPVANAVPLALRMRDRGVAIRPFDDLAPVSPALRATGGNAIRISVGPWDAIETTLSALRESLG